MKNKRPIRWLITAMAAAAVIFLFAGCQQQKAPTPADSRLSRGGVLEQIYAAEFEGQEGITHDWTEDAKGNEQLIIKESTDDAGRLVRQILIYDRKSQNDACDLVALEQFTYEQRGQERHTVDTSILNIYAVVQKTGEVIPSGKTDWGDLGSADYRKAIGE